MPLAFPRGENRETYEKRQGFHSLKEICFSDLKFGSKETDWFRGREICGAVSNISPAAALRSFCGPAKRMKCCLD